MDNLNTVCSFDFDDAAPLFLDVSKSNSDIASLAGRTFRSWPEWIVAADGTEILLRRAERGRDSRRTKHLIWHNAKNQLDIAKARWLPNVPDTLKHAQLRLLDVESQNVVYARGYAGVGMHMVVVTLERSQGCERGGLVTQFPYEGHGRQGNMPITWMRGGEKNEGAKRDEPLSAPNYGNGQLPDDPKPTPSTSLIPGSQPKEFQ